MSFDFGLTLPTTMDYQQNAGDYWGRVHARAQQEWSDQRGRDAADRDGRMQRDIGRGNLEAYRQRRSQFDNQNSVLQGLHRGDQTPYTMPNATSTTAPPVGTGTTTPAPATTELAGGPDNKAGGNSTKQWRQEQVGDPRSVTNTQGDANFEPVQSLNDLTPEQRRAHQDYVRANYSGVGSAARRESTARRAREVGLTYDHTGRLLRRRTAGGLDTLPDTFDISSYDETPTVDPQADLQAQGATNSATGTAGAGTGTSTALPANYLGTQDTSGPLQMTPDMQLMDMSIQDSMRNAEIYARYGRNDLAEQHMNLALTGQAAMHQQQNILLLRGAAEGNMDAAARLAERLNGRPPGTARFVPTPEDHTRYVLVVRGSDGVERNISQMPSTREEIYASFEAGVDATGVAQRRAASAAVENNVRDNETDRYVADRNFQANVLRTFTEAETARYEGALAQARAVGAQTHMLTDGDGGVYITWPTYNSDGTVEINTNQVRVGEVQTAGTNGTTTTQGLIVNRATGTGNTTARTN